MRSERNITRMDYERSHGWCVRIYRGTGRDKTLYTKFFSDNRQGGKRKALAAARAWRDRTLAKLGPGERGGSRTALGHGYVRRVHIVQRSGIPYPYWQAWIRMGHHKGACTKRSIELHGSAEAKRQCVAWLKERRAALRVQRTKTT